jgi:hypothetical protein
VIHCGLWRQRYSPVALRGVPVAFPCAEAVGANGSDGSAVLSTARGVGVVGRFVRRQLADLTARFRSPKVRLNRWSDGLWNYPGRSLLLGPRPRQVRWPSAPDRSSNADVWIVVAMHESVLALNGRSKMSAVTVSLGGKADLPRNGGVDAIDPTPTSASISCCGSEAGFIPIKPLV